MNPLESSIMLIAPQTRYAVANGAPEATTIPTEFGQIWSQLANSEGEDTAGQPPEVEVMTVDEEPPVEDISGEDDRHLVNVQHSSESQREMLRTTLLGAGRDDPVFTAINPITVGDETPAGDEVLAWDKIPAEGEATGEAEVQAKVPVRHDQGPKIQDLSDSQQFRTTDLMAGPKVKAASTDDFAPTDQTTRMDTSGRPSSAPAAERSDPLPQFGVASPQRQEPLETSVRQPAMPRKSGQPQVAYPEQMTVEPRVELGQKTQPLTSGAGTITRSEQGAVLPTPAPSVPPAPTINTPEHRYISQPGTAPVPDDASINRLPQPTTFVAPMPAAIPVPEDAALSASARGPQGSSKQPIAGLPTGAEIPLSQAPQTKVEPSLRAEANTPILRPSQTLYPSAEAVPVNTPASAEVATKHAVQPDALKLWSTSSDVARAAMADATPPVAQQPTVALAASAPVRSQASATPTSSVRQAYRVTTSQGAVEIPARAHTTTLSSDGQVPPPPLAHPALAAAEPPTDSPDVRHAPTPEASISTTTRAAVPRTTNTAALPAAQVVVEPGFFNPLNGESLLDAPLDAQLDVDGFAISPVGSTATAGVATTSIVAPQASPAAVAQQIATSFAQGSGKTTEIALNPEELGRVRISLTTTESGMTVSIISERPETTDLMRRHIDTLAREFAELGYDSLAFSFENPSDGAEQYDPESDTATTSGESDALAIETHIISAPSVTPTGGLDLKL